MACSTSRGGGQTGARVLCGTAVMAGRDGVGGEEGGDDGGDDEGEEGESGVAGCVSGIQ